MVRVPSPLATVAIVFITLTFFWVPFYLVAKPFGFLVLLAYLLAFWATMRPRRMLICRACGGLRKGP